MKLSVKDLRRIIKEEVDTVVHDGITSAIHAALDVGYGDVSRPWDE